jgi:hypothetical protein
MKSCNDIYNEYTLEANNYATQFGLDSISKDEII